MFEITLIIIIITYVHVGCWVTWSNTTVGGMWVTWTASQPPIPTKCVKSGILRGNDLKQNYWFVQIFTCYNSNSILLIKNCFSLNVHSSFRFYTQEPNRVALKPHIRRFSENFVSFYMILRAIFWRRVCGLCW